MVLESVITEEMRRMIGVEAPPYTIEVEKGAVRKFLDATGTADPLFQDEEFAKKTRYGGIITPPTFLSPDPVSATRTAGLERLPNPFKYDIDGGSVWGKPTISPFFLKLFTEDCVHVTVSNQRVCRKVFAG